MASKKNPKGKSTASLISKSVKKYIYENDAEIGKNAGYSYERFCNRFYNKFHNDATFRAYVLELEKSYRAEVERMLQKLAELEEELSKSQKYNCILDIKNLPLAGRDSVKS